MVKLRLARFGKKGQAQYRIVAINARTKRNTDAIEYLGYYNPLTNPSTIEFDAERVQYWLDHGAQPTYTVKSLLVIKGFMKADIKKRPATKKPKSETEKPKPAEEKPKTNQPVSKEETAKATDEPAPEAETEKAVDTKTEAKTETSETKA